MIAVIDYSNDPKIYNLCGDKIKYNYELIKHLILKFKNNTRYIIKLAEDYFDATRTEEDEKDFPTIEYLEVLLTLDKFLKPKLEDDIIIEKLRVKKEYLSYRMSFEIALKNGGLDYDHSSMGFDIIEFTFPGSVLIKDFFAYNMIDEIISSTDLEKKLHSSYKGKPIAPKSTLVKLIKEYDLELADYVATRIKEFTPFVKKVEDIMARWVSYEKGAKIEKSIDIIDAIYLFLSENGYMMLASDNQILTYFGRKYNFIDEIGELESDYTPEELDLSQCSFAEIGLINKLDNIVKLIVAGEYDPYIKEETPSICEIRQYKLPINK